MGILDPLLSDPTPEQLEEAHNQGQEAGSRGEEMTLGEALGAFLEHEDITAARERGRENGFNNQPKDED